jgi:hypothetical protein
MILDDDVVIINNILLASSAPFLTELEVENLSPIFSDNRSYFDFTESLLINRKSTNIIMINFYNFAETNGYTYQKKLSAHDMVIIGRA